MCGIFGAIVKNKSLNHHLIPATQIIQHRGPDDSGYMIWSSDQSPQFFADQDTAKETQEVFQLPIYQNQPFQVAFGHRRLSILDLSPSGHQPMSFLHYVISFNGEVYNYIEIREELKNLGRTFQTGTDTEVILQAWDQWGEAALHRFNGMFAFLILDTLKKKVIAVRDRFGVKPIYFSSTTNYMAFGSEAKQLRILPDYSFKLDQQIAYDYLRYGYLDHKNETFDQGIEQLMPGHLLIYDLNTHVYQINPWYHLKPNTWTGSLEDAQEQLRFLLKSAVELRLRSDVPVGSALSGGLDSSTIVCLMRDILDERGEHSKKLETVSSCSTDPRFDETYFAEIVNQKTNSISHKIYPDFEGLKEDLDRLIWMMDFPFGSTSQYSQWSVFRAASQAGLTVMIDGQGADEQLAGYGGNDLSFYSGLLLGLKGKDLLQEVSSYKRINGHYPIGFLLGAIQQSLPENLVNLFPKKYRPHLSMPPNWLTHKGFQEHSVKSRSLQENLLHQIYTGPLPALLRYEDRNSMAFSVESRTPFMDYRLIEFILGLPERYVYRNGERKYILRQSFRGIVPNEILDRRDKMGFVSAEERWFKEEGKKWFSDQIGSEIDGLDLIQNESANALVKGIQEGKLPFNFEPWRILNFKKWLSNQ